MMREAYSTRNYDDSVEWLTPPDYHHAPFRVGNHIIPVTSNASIVALKVEPDPNGLSVTVVIRPGDA